MVGICCAEQKLKHVLFIVCNSTSFFGTVCHILWCKTVSLPHYWIMICNEVFTILPFKMFSVRRPLLNSDKKTQTHYSVHNLINRGKQFCYSRRDDQFV